MLVDFAVDHSLAFQVTRRTRSHRVGLAAFAKTDPLYAPNGATMGAAAALATGLDWHRRGQRLTRQPLAPSSVGAQGAKFIPGWNGAGEVLCPATTHVRCWVWEKRINWIGWRSGGRCPAVGSTASPRFPPINTWALSKAVKPWVTESQRS